VLLSEGTRKSKTEGERREQKLLYLVEPFRHLLVTVGSRTIA
jgi:hypothetical protein